MFFACFPYFDHDALMHHALHVLDAPALGLGKPMNMDFTPNGIMEGLWKRYLTSESHPWV